MNCYIWKKAQSFQCVLDYLAGLPLTFEARNLDHTLEFEEIFESAGDSHSAAIVRAIHRDEIEHVRFGYEWLQRLKPDDRTAWEAFETHLKWPLRPSKARGETFRAQPRLQAGLPQEFVAALRNWRDSETGDY
ncbi:MAG: DUF455 family protein [Planctomycetaceae bacterium]